MLVHLGLCYLIPRLSLYLPLCYDNRFWNSGSNRLNEDTVSINYGEICRKRGITIIISFYRFAWSVELLEARYLGIGMYIATARCYLPCEDIAQGRRGQMKWRGRISLRKVYASSSNSWTRSLSIFSNFRQVYRNCPGTRFPESRRFEKGKEINAPRMRRCVYQENVHLSNRYIFFYLLRINVNNIKMSTRQCYI